MNKNYNRILVEDTQGNRSYKGVYDPTKEDVEITKKKPELTPKQKAFLRELNRKNGEAKEVFELSDSERGDTGFGSSGTR